VTLMLQMHAKLQTKQETKKARAVVRPAARAGRTRSELSDFAARSAFSEFFAGGPCRVPEKKDDDKDGFSVVSPPCAPYNPAAGLLRSILPRDRPFRTTLGYFVNLVTSAAGVVNITFPVAGISSSTEWSSIDTLFDEFFVHSQVLKFTTRNNNGGGFGIPVAGAVVPNFLATTISSNAYVGNAGLIMAALYTAALNYSTASAMIANPTHSIKHSGRDWTFPWRNNVRFDPRGPALSSGTAEAWQGWTAISGVSAYGGNIQIRTANDVVIGDGVHAVTMGDVAVMFDVSFRARS